MDRWSRVEELFHAGLARPLERRASFLSEACPDDPQLCKEVLMLLEHAARSDSFLEGSPIPARFLIAQGSNLESWSSLWSPTPKQIHGYRIVEELGRGGSSIVFRARRETGEEPSDVAIKVLRFANWNETRKHQLSTERQILCQLCHPNIVRMFGSGTTPTGIPYLVMELVDGRNLDAFCRDVRPSLAACLSLFAQVLQAVGFAHQNSIVHCDLKPANILVTAGGQTKLLDFGISKLFESDLDATLTLERRFTPAYASPEQIRGSAIGHASDIYSLGVILYELVTGRLPYEQGNRNVNELSLAVLEEPVIPPSYFSAELPRKLDGMILRALEKSPAHRYASVEEFANAISMLSVAGKPPGSGYDRSMHRPKRVVAICVAMAGLILTLLWFSLNRSSEPLAYTGIYTPLTSAAEFAAYPSFSPLADKIAYASGRGSSGTLNIWLQTKTAQLPMKLSSGTGDDTDPAFSADGRWVAFHSEREPKGIYLTIATGGSEDFLAPFGQSPRFSPSGKTLLYWTADLHTRFGSVWSINLNHSKEPFRLASDFEDAHNAVWTPDGRSILICGTRRANGGLAEGHDFWIVPGDGSPPIKTGVIPILARSHIDPHVLTLRSTSFVWLDDGLLFGASQNDQSGLWVIPISRHTWKVSGEPRRFAGKPDLTKQEGGASWRTIHPAIAGSASAFTRARADVQVWSLPVQAETAVVRGLLKRLTDERFEHLMPSVSVDGHKALFLGMRNGQLAVFSQDARTGHGEQLPGPNTQTNRVKISGDGRYAFWRVLEGHGKMRQAIYRTDLVDGKSNRVCADCGGPVSVSFNGSVALYENGSAITRIGVLLAVSGEKRDLIRHSFLPVQSARLSTDGRWVVFELDRGQEGKQLFVSPFHESAPVDEREWVPFTPYVGFAEEPAWSPGGNWIYYFDRSDGFRCLWARRWDGRAGKPTGSPVSVQHFHSARRAPLLLMDRASRYIGLSIARDFLVLSVSEVESQVWRNDIFTLESFAGEQKADQRSLFTSRAVRIRAKPPMW